MILAVTDNLEICCFAFPFIFSEKIKVILNKSLTLFKIPMNLPLLEVLKFTLLWTSVIGLLNAQIEIESL